MTIAEVSKRLEISADTLRYYERIGLIPPVPRNKNGIRNYDERSLGWLNFIKCMRKSGIRVEKLIEYVTLFQEGDLTKEARKIILIEQEQEILAKIEELNNTLNYLKTKLENYALVIEAENNLK